MNTLAVVSSSDKLILIGIGLLLGGALGVIAIRKQLIPGLPIKWGIITAGVLVGIVLVVTGLIKK